MFYYDVATFSANVLIYYCKNYFRLFMFFHANNNSEASSLNYKQVPMDG